MLNSSRRITVFDALQQKNIEEFKNNLKDLLETDLVQSTCFHYAAGISDGDFLNEFFELCKGWLKNYASSLPFKEILNIQNYVGRTPIQAVLQNGNKNFIIALNNVGISVFDLISQNEAYAIILKYNQPDIFPLLPKCTDSEINLKGLIQIAETYGTIALYCEILGYGPSSLEWKAYQALPPKDLHLLETNPLSFCQYYQKHSRQIQARNIADAFNEEIMSDYYYGDGYDDDDRSFIAQRDLRTLSQ